MTTSLVRGKYVICKVNSRDDAEIIEDGALFQQDGIIKEIGKFEDLFAKYPEHEIIGEPTDLVMSGYTNSHHHIGLTGIQRGVNNEPLEIWAANMLGTFGVDQYLDTFYSAFEMIESGVTTVQHIHGWMPGPLDQLRGAAADVLRAYQDIGMRVSYSHAVREQNFLVYESDEKFLKTLPREMAGKIAADLKGHYDTSAEDYLTLFEELYREYNDQDRIRVQLSPSNLHWCSDATLEKLQSYSERYAVPMHMHLLETMYQKEYARRRSNSTAIEHLHRLGLLGPHMTLGHGTWTTRSDIELIAETGTHICHNCSSNLCMGNGIMPLNQYQEQGVKVAIGIDGAGLNDDRDMLQEMRLIQNIHKVPGAEPEAIPNPNQIFQMATERGAATTPYGDQIGTLETGKLADIVIMDWQQLSLPYLDRDMPVIDAIVHRGKSKNVKTVIIGGEPILRDREYTRFNKQEILNTYADKLKNILTDEDLERRELFKRVVPFVRDYFRNYAESNRKDWML